MPSEALLPRVLFLFGVGFLAANVKVLGDLLRFRRRRRFALLIWQGPKPRYYGFTLGLGVALGVLLFFKIVVQRPAPNQVFGEAMMFLYYGYLFPLSTRIARGFYRDGIWCDSGFIPWAQISAVSWKDDGAVTLVLISHIKTMARRLHVPGRLYGEARRLMRDRVKAHDLHVGGTGLDLGSRSEQDAI